MARGWKYNNVSALYVSELYKFRDISRCVPVIAYKSLRMVILYRSSMPRRRNRIRDGRHGGLVLPALAYPSWTPGGHLLSPESDKIILLTPFLIEKTENNINFIKSIAFFLSFFEFFSIRKGVDHMILPDSESLDHALFLLYFYLFLFYFSKMDQWLVMWPNPVHWTKCKTLLMGLVCFYLTLIEQYQLRL